VPNSKQGNKVARTAERKRLRNRSARSSVKTLIAKAKGSSDAGEESAGEKTRMAISGVDKAANKGIIHRNKAARLKSRLTKNLNKGQ
jgi:small subunit ribosomal protein S20